MPRLRAALFLLGAAACFQDSKSVTTGVGATEATSEVDTTSTTTLLTASSTSSTSVGETTSTTSTTASETTSTTTGDPPDQLVVEVADAYNDALEDPDASMKVLFGWTTLNSPDHWGAMRFALPGLPQGATIVAAEFQVYIDGADTASPRAEIYGQRDPNPPVFSEELGDIAVRERTKASVLWTGDELGEGWAKSPSLVSVIQELVDQEGWAPGQHVVLILDATAEASDLVPFEYRQWDYGVEFAPVLGIQYYP
ncbi:MAG: hypothetical protein R3B09_05155 [Nannocystaceae bacterium]